MFSADLTRGLLCEAGSVPAPDHRECFQTYLRSREVRVDSISCKQITSLNAN